MENGSKQGSSIGSTPNIRMGKDNASAQPRSTEKSDSSPDLKTVPTKEGSTPSLETTNGQPLELTPKILMAVMILIEDFKALKELSSTSRQVANNGKVYQVIDLPGHDLMAVNGILMVNGQPLEDLLENLMAKSKKR